MSDSRQERITSATTPGQVAPRAAPQLPRVLRRVLALADFEEPARRCLPRPIFGYVSGGSETNASVRDNRAAYDALSLVPRVLVNTSDRTLKTTIFLKSC